MSAILIIVESPSKCKKIEEYLGENYKCIATCGHIYELTDLEDIDMQTFNAKYILIKSKNTTIEYLKKEIKKTNEIILATDRDAEGERIAFDICDLFNLSVETTKRIVFNEITKEALQKSIQNPSKINIDLVKSQKTRQILDLLIGFNITPQLWKYISVKGNVPLSAGRCQTPTLRLIYDNYLELNTNVGEKYYKTTGYFTKLCIPFELNKDFTNKEDVAFFLEQCVHHKHIFNISEPKKIEKTPPKPLITSTLQQKANNELHYSIKDTMKLCQELYESGKITYMRTETKKYSSYFLEQVSKYLKEEWNMLPASKEALNELDISNELTNHEGIRPTNIKINEYTFKKNNVPEDFKKLSNKAIKLYFLIWRHSIQSCMDNAVYYQINASITAFNNYEFKYTTEKICKENWIFFEHLKTENRDKPFNLLENLILSSKKSCEVKYLKITSQENIKHLKTHYSEALLVNKLEQLGIGRPSTFSLLVEKIQEREYVKKQNIIGKEMECFNFVLEENKLENNKIIKVYGEEKNKLIIQPLGILVVEFLINYYNEIFNYDYTKNMEFFLDEIEKKIKQPFDICFSCNNELLKCKSKLEGIKKYQLRIDENNVFMVGKNGPVIKNTDKEGHIHFNSVKEDIDMKKLNNNEYVIEDIVKQPTNICIGEYNNESLLLKKGQYGMYVEYGNNKKSLKGFGNRPIENITFDEVFQILEEEQTQPSEKKFFRKISNNISIREGKTGDYIFFKTPQNKKPSFFKLTEFTENPRTCAIKILQNWIKQKYNIY
jgi:DNA topoisomerase-1